MLWELSLLKDGLVCAWLPEHLFVSSNVFTEVAGAL